MDDDSDRRPETSQPAASIGRRKTGLLSRWCLIVLVAGFSAAIGVGWYFWAMSGILDKPGLINKPAVLDTPSIRPSTSPSLVRDDAPPQTQSQLAAEARLLAERLADAFPDDPQAVEIKAQVLYYLGDFSAAADSWRRCLELDPHYAFAHSGLGSVAAKTADFEAAAAHYRKALEFAPEGAEHVWGLADVLIKSNNAEEAVAVIEDYLRSRGGTFEIYSLLGRAYQQTRRYEKATDAFAEALQCDPEDIGAQFGFASALARLGRRDEAEREMAKLKELRAKKKESSAARREWFDDLASTSRNLSVRYSWMGRVYFAHGKVSEAESLWLRAARLDPAATECRMHLASLYQRAGRGGQAVEMCRQLAEIDPGNAYFRRNLGTMCANLGLFEDAEAAFEEAVRLAPQDAETHRSLARLYLQSGRQLGKAVGLARAAAELAPSEENYLLLRDACSRNGDRAGAISAAGKAAAIQEGGKP